MIFTLGDWVGIVLSFIGVAIIGVFISAYFEAGKKGVAIALLVSFIVAGCIAGGIALYNTHTESGKRALKSWESEISGGMNRVVHVYDMEGEEIATYKGKFDIQENAQDGIVKVKFDVDGERHIIYGSTGTIVIDEIPVEEGEDGRED